jgi:hypothetical protein
MPSERPSTIAATNAINLSDGYQEFRQHQWVDLHPWHLVSEEEFDRLFAGVNARYPERHVIPFARRSDNDDVACFVSIENSQVPGSILVVHDFASPGFEVVARQKSFWAWFRYALNEIADLNEDS